MKLRRKQFNDQLWLQTAIELILGHRVYTPVCGQNGLA